MHWEGLGKNNTCYYTSLIPITCCRKKLKLCGSLPYLQSAVWRQPKPAHIERVFCETSGRLRSRAKATANTEKFMKVVHKYIRFKELPLSVTGVCGENRKPQIGNPWRETPGKAPHMRNWNLLFFHRQGRIVWRIKPDLSDIQPNRNGNFFTLLLLFYLT